MMGMVEDVAAYLDAQSTRFTQGTNLFINVVPHSTRAVVSILESGGSPPSQVFGDGNLPAWENQSLQLLARTTQPSSGATVPYSTTARSLIQHAFVLLNQVTNETLSGSTFLRIEPDQSPFLVPGQEEDGRLVFSCNFSVWRRPST